MKIHYPIIKRLVTYFLIIVACVALPSDALSDYQDGYYDVSRIIDGDTFELANGQTVRLIGIDTPEEGQRCFDQAKQQLISLIAGESVYLEKDVSETDRYGRLLRYVYVNGIFVNEYLVFEGFAYAVEYPPDTKYADQLNEAEQNAEENGRGCLWGDPCPSGCYVHITATGSKYHAADCRYLSQSDFLICRDDALVQGYTACSVCGGACDNTIIGDGDDDGGGGGGCYVSTASDSHSKMSELMIVHILICLFLVSLYCFRN
jgi:micrococcal nuclease